MNRVAVLVGAAAAALLALSARSRESVEPLQPTRKPVSLARTVPVAVTEPPAPTRVETPPPPAEPSRASAPAVPPGVEEDLRMLQEWILSLPSADLRALDRSGELNRRLARIVAELAKRNAAELDRFLGQLNARLGVVPP